MDIVTTNSVKSTADLMRNFQERFKNRTPEKVLYPRQQLIKMFVDRLNKERMKGSRELAPGFIASRMYRSGLKTDADLWWFYGYLSEKFEQTKNSNYFSVRWWWLLDPKNCVKINP